MKPEKKQHWRMKVNQKKGRLNMRIKHRKMKNISQVRRTMQDRRRTISPRRKK